MPIILAELQCGGCGNKFEANVYSVPQYCKSPACKKCWDLINARRLSLGLPMWETPIDAYLPT